VAGRQNTEAPITHTADRQPARLGNFAAPLLRKIAAPLTRVSFALNDKPFASENWFHTQHLVASLWFIGASQEAGKHTFHPPYVPELNEFFARTMNFQHDRLRVEPERIGLVTDAMDHNAFLKALPVFELAERIFELLGSGEAERGRTRRLPAYLAARRCGWSTRFQNTRRAAAR
jgi:hypothetical protein